MPLNTLCTPATELVSLHGKSLFRNLASASGGPLCAPTILEGSQTEKNDNSILVIESRIVKTLKAGLLIVNQTLEKIISGSKDQLRTTPKEHQKKD